MKPYLIRDLAILLAVVLLLILAAFGIQRGLAGKSEPAGGEAPAVSLALEATLKSLIKETIQHQEHLVEAPVLEEAMASIRDRLLGAMEPLPYEPEILILDSPVVNALAFPGGLMVIYSGLIEQLESPEELAAVLAHELGHVFYRHAMKNLIRSIGLATLISLLGGRQAEVLIRRIIREVVSMRFSRAAEAEADDFALNLLTRAEIDPLYLGKALQRLRERMRGQPAGFLKYLDSHPEIDSRIEKARSASREMTIITQPLGLDWRVIQEALPSPF